MADRIAAAAMDRPAPTKKPAPGSNRAAGRSECFSSRVHNRPAPRAQICPRPSRHRKGIQPGAAAHYLQVAPMAAIERLTVDDRQRLARWLAAAEDASRAPAHERLSAIAAVEGLLDGYGLKLRDLAAAPRLRPKPVGVAETLADFKDSAAAVAFVRRWLTKRQARQSRKLLDVVAAGTGSAEQIVVLAELVKRARRRMVGKAGPNGA
jgi:hypothetical protein